MRTRMLAVLCVLTALACASGCGGGGGSGTSGGSELVLDAHFDPRQTTDIVPGLVVSTDWTGQVFVAGISGALQRVSVMLVQEAPGPLEVLIYRVVGGLPDNSPGGLLGGVTVGDGVIPTTGPMTWSDIDLSATGIPVTAGQAYAIVLRTSGSTWFDWLGASGDHYGAGTAVQLTLPVMTWYGPPTDFDYAFRVYIGP